MDIATAVMTLSGFLSNPRRGHLERTKQIYGYLAKMRYSTIHIRTDMPDSYDIPDKDYDWKYTVYGNVEERKLNDIPTP